MKLRSGLNRIAGVTGHQDRPGIDWAWTRAAISRELAEFGATQALTSLAVGADQVFAEIALELGIAVTAVIPFPNYDRVFGSRDLERYRELLAQSRPVVLPGKADDEASFFGAGAYIVEHCELLIAVWDEKPAAGFGGTADVVAYARDRGGDIVVLNPITRQRTSDI